MTTRDFAALWAGAYCAALSAYAARILFLLGALDPDPPDDPVARTRWVRRRRWLAASEFAALPMFATLSVLAAAQGWVSPVMAVGCALVSGALGFAFFVHALEAVVRRRLQLPESGA